MLKIILMSFLLTSCSSISAGDWGPWERCGVATEKENWRWCDRDKDGEELHRKGICYQADECRSRKTIFGNVKIETRVVRLHCSWGDLECMDRYKLWPKIITNP